MDSFCDKSRGDTLVRRIATASLILAAVFGLGFWLIRDPVVYSHSLSSKHKLTIRTSPSPSNDQIRLQVTYHYPPALGTFIVAEQIVNQPTGDLTFTSVVDPETDIQCVHDNNDIGFLLMYHSPTDDLWDTTGRSGGWHGSDNSIWQDRLSILRQKHPSIPYSLLPDPRKNRRTKR